MSTSEPWVGEVLRKVNIGDEGIDESKIDRYRMVLDRSGLAERMCGTCDAMNVRSAQVLIYREVFPQPHPIVRRYILEHEEDRQIIAMELTILLEGPVLVFSRNTTTQRVKSIRRYRGYERRNVMCKIAIDPEKISDDDLQQWFIYLLSGLQHSLKPQGRGPSLNEN